MAILVRTLSPGQKREEPACNGACVCMCRMRVSMFVFYSFFLTFEEFRRRGETLLMVVEGSEARTIVASTPRSFQSSILNINKYQIEFYCYAVSNFFHFLNRRLLFLFNKNYNIQSPMSLLRSYERSTKYAWLLKVVPNYFINTAFPYCPCYPLITAKSVQ